MRRFMMASHGHFLVVLLVSMLICESHGYFNYHGSKKYKHGGLHLRQKRQVTTCDSDWKYRSYDGSCHNVDSPSMGQTGSVFRRLLDPVYDDEVNTPRAKATDGTLLANARSISEEVHDPLDRLGNSMNHMVMQWGQFIDHDITLTPSGTKEGGECCSDELITSGAINHPDVAAGGVCFPILIEEGDHHFTEVSDRCMYLLRSDNITVNGVRQQYNLQSAWVDGSHIYGTTEELASQLRSLDGGRMKVKIIGEDEFLPEDETADKENDCFLRDGSDDYCFLAGDSRVMAYPGLNAMHTIFVRYHNQIAGELEDIHPDWSDEALYQEARRVVVAVLQKVTYDEFLPHVLGQGDNTAQIKSTATFSYSNSTDAGLPNVFSTAAFRFGHSMIGDSLQTGTNTVTDTEELFNRPSFVLDSLNSLVDGIMEEPTQRTDRWYVSGMTDHMFEKPDAPRSGFDIAARNIQRGRDHGLPGYNEWREHCNLPRKTSFLDLDNNPGTSRVLARHYNSVDDIDLYTGGVTESPIAGQAVGETYTCLLKQAFEDLKFGDRFWYQNTGDASSFTTLQIAEINRMRLSKVFCDTLGLTQIQRNVFRLVSGTNPLVDCSSLNDVRIDRQWVNEEIPVTIDERTTPTDSPPLVPTTTTTETPTTAAPTEPAATTTTTTRRPRPGQGGGGGGRRRTRRNRRG